MKILELFTYEDISSSKLKKIIFLAIGFIVTIIGYITLLNIRNEILRRIISIIIGCSGFGYFILPVIWLSFIEPLYLIKNKFVRIIFPLIMNLGGFVFYIRYSGYTTPIIALIFLILLSIGYMFSSSMDELYIQNIYLYFINLTLSWWLSRFLFSIILFLNGINLLNLFHEIIIN